MKLVFLIMKIFVSLNLCWVVKRNIKLIYISLCIFSIIILCYYGYMKYVSNNYICGSDFGYLYLKFENLESIFL